VSPAPHGGCSITAFESSNTVLVTATVVVKALRVDSVVDYNSDVKITGRRWFGAAVDTTKTRCSDKKNDLSLRFAVLGVF
jgi:hypothetical protein